MLNTFFRQGILEWYQRHKRDLPWRNSNDPYIIWLSEIILQQTRVNQGLPYFYKFIKNYPTVEDLALAEEGQVMRDWEGLGYYSRARNLHAAAKHVHHTLHNKFPSSYTELLKLKGVGNYTAAAISSFVNGEPRAVVDGNVFRVLSRFYAVDTPINTGAGKKEFEQLANQLLDPKDPATYNQAIMEFGALQCVPKNPDCSVCPLNSKCKALAANKVKEYPVKTTKKYDRHRYLNYLFLSSANGRVFLVQRTGRDIWQNLYEFPLVEKEHSLDPDALLEEIGLIASDLEIREQVDIKPHKLSHQTLHCRIVYATVDREVEVTAQAVGEWIKKESLKEYAFPKPLRDYLDRKQLTLPLD